MEKAVNAHPNEFMSTSSMVLTSSGLSLSPAELTEKALRLIKSSSGHLRHSQSIFLISTLLWCRLKVSLADEVRMDSLPSSEIMAAKLHHPTPGLLKEVFYFRRSFIL